MARRGRPKKVGPGIYRYENRYRVTASAWPHQRETSFKLDPPIDTILRWQVETRASLLSETPIPYRRRDVPTLKTDVPRFLATLPEGSDVRMKHRIELGHWTETPLGKKPRALITRTDILTQLAAWEAAGRAAS